MRRTDSSLAPTVLPEPPADLMEMKVDYGTDTLRNYLVDIAMHMNRQGRILNQVLEESMSLRTDLAAINDRLDASDKSMASSVRDLGQRLTMVENKVNLTVDSITFNEVMEEQRHNIRQLEGYIQRVESHGGEQMMEAMAKFNDDYMAKWYAGVCLKDAEARHAVTEERIKACVALDVDRLDAGINDLNSKVVVKSELKTAVENAKDEGARGRQAAQEDIRMLRSMMDKMSEGTKRELDSVRSATKALTDTCGERIRTMYAVFDLKEDDCVQACRQDRCIVPVESAVQPSISGTTSRGGFRAGFAEENDSPFGQPSPRRAESPSGAFGGGGAFGSGGEVGVASEDPSAREDLVLQSLPFVAFRRTLHDDVNDRVKTALHSSFDDIEHEVQGIRADLAHKTDPPHVLELIRQNIDGQLPLQLAELRKEVQLIENSKIDNALFIEALRTKADGSALTTKADEAYVDDAVSQHVTELRQLKQMVAETTAERLQFKEVLRDVLLMHKRSARGQPTSQFTINSLIEKASGSPVASPKASSGDGVDIGADANTPNERPGSMDPTPNPSGAMTPAGWRSSKGHTTSEHSATPGGTLPLIAPKGNRLQQAMQMQDDITVTDPRQRQDVSSQLAVTSAPASATPQPPKGRVMHGARSVGGTRGERGYMKRTKSSGTGVMGNHRTVSPPAAEDDIVTTATKAVVPFNDTGYPLTSGQQAYLRALQSQESTRAAVAAEPVEVYQSKSKPATPQS